MLSRNLKAVNITASELGLLEKACMQQPWMVDIAARALSQGSVSQQQLLKLIGKPCRISFRGVKPICISFSVTVSIKRVLLKNSPQGKLLFSAHCQKT